MFYDLRQQLEDEESKIAQQAPKPPNFYQTVFPKGELAVKDVLSRWADCKDKVGPSSKKQAPPKPSSYPMAMTFF